MYRKTISRKKRILILCVVVAVCSIGGIVLHEVSGAIDDLEMFTLIGGLILLGSLLEVTVVWWEGRHRTVVSSDSPLDISGKKGTVVRECRPEGTVNIGSTMWRAVSVDGVQLEPGDEIIVEDRDGLKLFVRSTGSRHSKPNE